MRASGLSAVWVGQTGAIHKASSILGDKARVDTTNVIPLKRKRSRRLRTLIDGEISEQSFDDIWQDEIERYRRCIQDAQANIRRVIRRLQIETELIDIWAEKIAEIEAKRSAPNALIDFPTLEQRDKKS